MDKDEIIGLVPAAGEGTRLYPFARAVPKEMYPILGKAVIEHCIENLKMGGVKKIYIIVGHQKGALMDYIGDGSFFDVNVAYIYQLRRMGLGHAILQGGNWIKNPFVVLLGDSFIEPKREMKDLIDLHKRERPISTVMLFEVEDPEGYGIVKLDDFRNGCGVVKKLVEKPSREEAEECKTNGKFYALCGAYVFEPRIFDYIRKTKPGAKNEIQITDSLELAVKSGENVLGFVMKGKYLDIGKWRTILRTEKEMLSGSDVEKHIRERERMMDKVKSQEGSK